MGWIDINDKMPPEGLLVLLEVSGRISSQYCMLADHDFYLGCWIVPESKKEGFWSIYDSDDEDNYHLIYPTVHAWMPLPKHYQAKEEFYQPKDLMEHAMFEKDPEWLYKGDYVYEQMTLEDFEEVDE